MAMGDGWLSEAQVERKKLQVTKRMWRVEYEMQEPNPEDSAFDLGKVREMFDISLGEYEGKSRNYIEVEPPMMICQHKRKNEDGELYICDHEEELQSCPNCGEYKCRCKKNKFKQYCPVCSTNDEQIVLKHASYATGADWARKKDDTVIITFRIDCDPARLVAYYRTNRRPWPDMVSYYEDRLRRYHSHDGSQKKSSHDGTGLGDVVDGYLNYDVEGFLMVGRKRRDLFTEYINAVERGEYKSAMVKSLKDAHVYVEVDDLFGNGHPPDEIVAAALAHRAASRPSGVLFR
jgi:hypothetical protein